MVVEYLRRGDRHLAYRVDGSGPLDVLFIRGLPVSIDVLDDEPHHARLNRRLAALGRVVQFDPPGIGLSDSPDTAVTFECIVDDSIAVLDALGIEEVVVIGGNEGGTFAIPLAAAVPDRVRALVLIDSHARAARAHDYPYGHDEALLRDYVDQMSDPTVEWSAEGVGVDALMAPSLAHDVRYKLWEERSIRQAMTPAMSAAYLRLIALGDVRPYLPSIEARTLVLARRDNRFLSPAHGRYIADHIPRATFIQLPGADHPPFAGDIDALMDEVEDFLIGQRGGGSDLVLTTVLFTDIVDSTALAAELGDRDWHALLDAHDAIVREELARHGGRTVNTTGDGFVGAFESPTRAIEAGRSIVSAVAATGVAVRIGIHTGECVRRGEDLAGLTVHIAARVGAKAAAHEVLVSRTVCDLLAGSHLEFLPRGEHDLKGVPGRWQLLAVAGTQD